MASNKQRGEKIMVFGTDQFLDYPIRGYKEMRLLEVAEKVVYANGGPVLAEALHCDPPYLSDNEFQEATSASWTAPKHYQDVKFMFACFILLALGEEI